MNIKRKAILRWTLIAALSCAAANAEDSYVFGPLEHVALDRSSITVLGQTFSVGNSDGQFSELAVGAYVYVSGVRQSDGGLVAHLIEETSDRYVAGASEVFLSGQVSKSDPAIGMVKIGGATVYVTEASVFGIRNFEIGETLEIVGSQAHPSGEIWAKEIRGASLLSTQGIQGTGALGNRGKTTGGIQGTGSLGIQGTGVQGIQGTGALGIQGTGALGIQGTGTSGIQGTGKLGIQGTGVQGIQGTGALGIQGTGIRGIQGTGTLGIQGTGTLGIQGTGVATY